MTPEIIEFKPEHLTAFEWRDCNRDESLEWWNEMIAQHEFRGFTGKVDNRIIGVAGIFLLGDGCAYIGMCFAPEIERYKIWLHRESRQNFLRLVSECGIKHADAWVYENSARDRKWIEKLGFDFTGRRDILPNGTPVLNYAVGIL